MNSLVTQLVCAARWQDFEDSGWVQILVFIIVAVLYALGSIAKMKKAKTEDKSSLGDPHKSKTGQMIPAAGGLSERQITEEQPDIAPYLGVPRPQRQVTVRPAPEWAKVVSQILEAVTGQALAPDGARQAVPDLCGSPAVPGIQVRPPSAAQAKLKAQPSAVRQVTKPQDKAVPPPAPAEVKMPETLSEILADYADPDLLRRVILHYEILGKPLSLRQPPENIIGS